MEALALLFVIGIFVALVMPEGKSKPKSSGEKLEEGIVAMAKTIKEALGGGGGPKPAPKNGLADNPWFVIILSVLLGFLFTYVI
jgi:hypothetical protein